MDLAVQDCSVGDLVTHLVSESLKGHVSTTALQCFLNFIKHCRAVVDTYDLSNKDKDNDYHYDREGDISSPRNRRPRRPWSEDRTHLGGGPKNLIAEEAEGTELGGLYLLNRTDE